MGDMTVLTQCIITLAYLQDSLPLYDYFLRLLKLAWSVAGIVPLAFVLNLCDFVSTETKWTGCNNHLLMTRHVENLNTSNCFLSARLDFSSLSRINNAKSTSPAVSSGEERWLLSRTAAGNRAYLSAAFSYFQIIPLRFADKGSKLTRAEGSNFVGDLNQTSARPDIESRNLWNFLYEKNLCSY